MSGRIQPLFARVLVARDKPAEITEAGIHIPQAAKTLPQTGTVVAVGEGRLCTEQVVPSSWEEGPRCHVEPLRVKEGDRVLFQEYAGTDVKDEKTGESYLLMEEDDILAILTD